MKTKPGNKMCLEKNILCTHQCAQTNIYVGLCMEKILGGNYND